MVSLFYSHSLLYIDGSFYSQSYAMTCVIITCMMYVVTQASWQNWGPWSVTKVPLCGAGQRSRQRTCTNTTALYCEVNCNVGSNQSDYQCCVGRFEE